MQTQVTSYCRKILLHTVISKIAEMFSIRQWFSLFNPTKSPLKLLEIIQNCHTQLILILMALPHSLTSSQGCSEDWLQVKSPAPPLASAPAVILGSWRLSPPPGICCYDCDCETLQVHRVTLWNKEMNHGHSLLNAEDAESKIKRYECKGAAENQDTFDA